MNRTIYILGSIIGISFFLIVVSPSENGSLRAQSIEAIEVLRGGKGNESKPAFVTPSNSNQGSQSPNTPNNNNNGNIGENSPRYYAAPGDPGLPDIPGNNGNYDPPDDNDFKKMQLQPETWTNWQNYCIEQSKNKKQCDLTEVESKFEEDSKLVKYSEKAKKNQKIKNEVDSIIEKLRLGNLNPGKGTKTLFNNVKEARGKNGARVYFREVNGRIEILGISNKVPRQQQAVIDILKQKYK